jgi:hypothetical protein
MGVGEESQEQRNDDHHWNGQEEKDGRRQKYRFLCQEETSGSEKDKSVY